MKQFLSGFYYSFIFLSGLFSIMLVVAILNLKTVFDYVKKKPPKEDLCNPEPIGKIHLFNKDTGEYEGYVDDSDLDVTNEFTEEEIREIKRENDFIPLIGISEKEILARV